MNSVRIYTYSAVSDSASEVSLCGHRMETTSSCAAPADPDPGQTTYSCEECDEYLLIHEASASSSEEHPPTLNQDVLQDASSNGKILKVEGEVTSGPPSAGTEQDSAPQEDYEEWCIVEQELIRPKGLYGYRYVDYDDQEAEGNIHITDQDL